MKIVAYNLVKIMIMLNGDDGNDHIPYDDDDLNVEFGAPCPSPNESHLVT